MAWTKLNVSLSIDPATIDCDGGEVVAKVTVTAETDGVEEENSFTLFLKEDYVIPDVLWKSDPVFLGPRASLNETFPVRLWCNDKCQVVGPHGNSRERTAEVYAYVESEEFIAQSDEVVVKCA